MEIGAEWTLGRKVGSEEVEGVEELSLAGEVLSTLVAPTLES